ncbi:hypothetical protein SAMN05421788_10789 [Filimonas lacunae]|uniref:Signal transducing protein n=1 Tax=Filimonas lacunae TaxID=477680 RepID=A0A173MG74_9BACT|nr:hypothetical protein [Filimonas lacunae]BAV06431.1 hypothetical protein FLA_2449 [Filimonas lacunae]SIT26933.1 hypothetical protein SAMN05421788_10789 [Filimonas lacunae]
MQSDYLLFQKFTDLETAEDFATELRANDISYHLIDHNNATNVKVEGYNTIQIAIELNIAEHDFPRAQQVLDRYYEESIKKIDPSYYLFEFSTEELKDIIAKPFEWGRLDYYLARHLLKQKGIEVTDEEVQQIKAERLQEMSKIEKVSQGKIVAGYLFAVLLPLAGLFIGFTIYYNRKLLPTGERFYLHTEDDRKNGQRILQLGVVCTLVHVAATLYYIANR